MWKDLFLLASPKEERTADRSSSSSFNRATRIDGVWPLGRRDDECRLLVNPMTLPFGSSSPLFRPYAISARLPPDVLTFSIDPQKLPFPLGSFLLFSSFRSFLSAPSGRSDRPVKRSTAKKKEEEEDKNRLLFSIYTESYFSIGLPVLIAPVHIRPHTTTNLAVVKTSLSLSLADFLIPAEEKKVENVAHKLSITSQGRITKIDHT
jgi:hypothetical protein